MKKYWKVLSAIALATILVTACGSGEVDQKTGSGDQTGYETPSEKDGNEVVINKDVVSTHLQFSDGYYTFSLENVTDKDVDLTFSSSQEYEYQIKDASGSAVYTYSMDKMFLQQIIEKTLTPTEGYVINVDVEAFSTLQPGTYTLEIWSVALEADGLSEEIEFTLEEVGNNIEGTFVGQIDNNSVEIIDAKGSIQWHSV
ncbi:hypothetical protein H1D32_11620 [Anaerobacillus sp. CMMVII]|uniref:BsuPI-related putative proteinase inhibitor n=1 Tax=Anaerobacillus sp. CMMVII TaxID=2755588 RepID=UPI0021B8264C|nr:BsuPI-related putative proteinase inhibitor [Anaerobacillus sp. CMMVII]MCT8138341.1 hypothetical protein [Anaerobacillus sp. CMMVII]